MDYIESIIGIKDAATINIIRNNWQFQNNMVTNFRSNTLSWQTLISGSNTKHTAISSTILRSYTAFAFLPQRITFKSGSAATLVVNPIKIPKFEIVTETKYVNGKSIFTSIDTIPINSSMKGL